MLALEALLLGLVAAVVAADDGRSDAGRWALVVVVLMLALLVAAGLARRSVVPGALLQLAVVALGLLTPVMWFLGPVFAALFGFALWLQSTAPASPPPPEQPT
jgi:hypothetical protein